MLFQLGGTVFRSETILRVPVEQLYVSKAWSKASVRDPESWSGEDKHLHP